MFDYSYGGIYFESDGVFEKGTPLYIGIHNSPYSPTSRVFEYFKGEVMWRKDLKSSLSKYGYGIQFASELAGEKIYINETKKSRKHPRKPFSRTVQFSTSKGLAKGTTKNISASGVFIATEEKLEVGQLLKLNIPLKNGKTSEIIGEIVRLNEEGFGFKFKKIK